jgi:hypothetical protein
VSCGRSIQFEANVCPYCGRDYLGSQIAHTKPKAVSLAVRIALYLISLLVPVAGIAVGLFFVLRPDPDHRHVGKLCLIFGAFSIIMTIVFALAIYAAVLAW